MTTRTAERIEDWESRPFSDGYDELRDLADRSFSGVVTAGAATCCFLNGAVVGILDGSIEDFEDATGTTYTAPSPALPLLIVMQKRQGEARAKYYSEETPLSEADAKLSDGGFTGFIELSENVLSGDYYVVYHGGRSMSVAFVGQSSQLLTEEEAFQQADDEVGIYHVYPVDIEPVEIPDPEPTADATDSAVAGVDTRDDDTPTETSEWGTSPGSESTADTGTTQDEHEPAGQPDRAEQPEPERADHGRAGEESGSPEREPGIEDSERAGRDRTVQDSERAGRERTTEDSERAGRERADDDPADHDRTSDRTEAVSGRTEREPDERERTPDRERGTDTRERAPDRERGTDERDGTAREPGVDERSGRADESPASGRDDRQARSTDAGSGASTDRGATARDREARSRTERDAANGGQPGAAGGGVAREPGESETDSGEPEPTVAGAGERSDEPDRSRDPLAAEPDSEPEPAAVGEPSGLERRTIPSLDPDRTRTSDGAAAEERPANDQRAGATGEEVERQPADTSRQGDRETAGEDLVTELREREAEIQSLEEEVGRLERERDEAVAERDELAAERDEIAAERDELAAELDQLRAERSELRREVESLREQVADLETSDAGTDAEIKLTPGDAIDQTDLRVRYGSKGDATLEAAHAGEADREAVESNLTLGYHTLFDDTNAAVEGQPFDAFLTDTLQFRFVEWIVHDLLYEIQETGNEDALRDLYDAIPRIHEVQLDHSVTVAEEETVAFDMAFYDVDGNLLAVANVNDTRNPVGETMVSELLTDATRVREAQSGLVGAFLVTASVFKPAARKVPKEETGGGGLLSRDSRESYVSVSRSGGFHLCLVENDEDNFHLDVPEL